MAVKCTSQKKNEAQEKVIVKKLKKEGLLLLHVDFD